MTGREPPARILAVCTGNICRSPAVERLLAARLAGTDVEVASAGTAAAVGHPVSAPMVPLVVAAGGSVEGFAARGLRAADVREADLVLTATRDHRRAVVALVPDAVRRTFTLRELAGLLAHVDPEELHASGPGPGARVRALPALAALARGSVRPGALDVRDPVGRSARVYRASFSQIAPAVDALATALLR